MHKNGKFIPLLRWDSHSFYLVVITSQINTLLKK